MLTIVMLNWRRPANVIKNIVQYATYGTVERILCFNNGAPLQAELPKKCIVLQASQDLGLWSRFAAGALACTDAVLHTDDDLWLPESTLDTLFAHWKQAPDRCHGLFGRKAQPQYEARNAFGSVEIVLTRAMICSRRLNNLAMAASELFEDLSPQPRGNGEDIVLSFAAMATSGRANRAWCLPFVDYPNTDAHAIHRRWGGHLDHRRLVTARCWELMIGAPARSSKSGR
jgi:hypothetical protein